MSQVLEKPLPEGDFFKQLEELNDGDSGSALSSSDIEIDNNMSSKSYSETNSSDQPLKTSNTEIVDQERETIPESTENDNNNDISRTFDADDSEFEWAEMPESLLNSPINDSVPNTADDRQSITDSINKAPSDITPTKNINSGEDNEDDGLNSPQSFHSAASEFELINNSYPPKAIVPQTNNSSVQELPISKPSPVPSSLHLNDSDIQTQKELASFSALTSGRTSPFSISSKDDLLSPPPASLSEKPSTQRLSSLNERGGFSSLRPLDENGRSRSINSNLVIGGSKTIDSDNTTPKRILPWKPTDSEVFKAALNSNLNNNSSINNNNNKRPNTWGRDVIPKRVKSEASISPSLNSRTPSDTPVEVLDLTSDDEDALDIITQKSNPYNSVFNLNPHQAVKNETSHSNTSVVSINDDPSDFKGNNRESLSDDDSDDDIMITGETQIQAPNTVLPKVEEYGQQPAFNQPAPLYHAGVPGAVPPRVPNDYLEPCVLEVPLKDDLESADRSLKNLDTVQEQLVARIARDEKIRDQLYTSLDNISIKRKHVLAVAHGDVDSEQVQKQLDVLRITNEQKLGKLKRVITDIEESQQKFEKLKNRRIKVKGNYDLLWTRQQTLLREQNDPLATLIRRHAEAKRGELTSSKTEKILYDSVIRKLYKDAGMFFASYFNLRFINKLPARFIPNDIALAIWDSYLKKMVQLTPQLLHQLKTSYNFRENNVIPTEPVIPIHENFNNYNPYTRNDNDHDDVTSIGNLLDSIKAQEVEEEGLAATPSEMSIQLLKHQRIGLTWMMAMENMHSHKGGILADDMGLGKTVQAISIILANPPKSPDVRTTLVVAPVSLMRQWVGEFEIKIRKECALNVYVYHQEKVPNFKELKKYDIVLTSYQTLASEMKKHFKTALEQMKKNRSRGLPVAEMEDIDDDPRSRIYTSPFFASESLFHRVILDEAQYVKNKLTQSSKAVALLKSEYRWCLSGTPMQNNIAELYPILRFLKIKPYNKEERFMREIGGPLKSSSTRYENRALQKVQALLSAIMLRRTKSSTIDGKPILSLPEKHIIIDDVKFTDAELKYYMALEDKTAKKAAELMRHERIPIGAYSSMLTLLLRLRQACCHNYMCKLAALNEDNRDKSGQTNMLEDTKAMYQTASRIKDKVLERVLEEERLGFTCPVCLDTVRNEDVFLLGICGHVICKDCIEDFYDRFTTKDLGTDKEAQCYACKGSIHEKGAVSYADFNQIAVQKISLLQYQTNKGVERKQPLNKTRLTELQEYVNSIGELMVSAKVDACIKLIKGIYQNHPDEKIIVFSQFTFLFDIMDLILANENMNFLRYDGSMSVSEKDATISRFYKEPKEKLMLISLKAGNVGLTLTCASRAIILDEAWNPYVMRQAEDRLHRIGQSKEVFIHHLLIKGTVEDRIMELQRQKQELIDAALDGKSRESINRLGRKELGFLFGLNSL